MKKAKGWCLQCRSRIGKPTFKQLVDGKACIDCYKHLEEREKIANSVNQIDVKTFLEREFQEEIQLLTAFEEIKGKIGKYWVAPVCQKLNWDYEQVLEVRKRLKKKGINLATQSLEKQLVELLGEIDEATASELGEKFAVGVPWIACLLKKLLEQNIVEMKKSGRKKVYKLKQNYEN